MSLCLRVSACGLPLAVVGSFARTNDATGDYNEIPRTDAKLSGNEAKLPPPRARDVRSKQRGNDSNITTSETQKGTPNWTRHESRTRGESIVFPPKEANLVPRVPQVSKNVPGFIFSVIIPRVRSSPGSQGLVPRLRPGKGRSCSPGSASLPRVHFPRVR